ncbi:MAG: DUF3078 domain-containing protein [Flavobacteriaceae bacterium]|nr:DUF3078 domain-containing protein [Flavobacteriaceae bacterium]
MKKILLYTFLLISFLGFSQDEAGEREEGWKKSGKITLLINQSAFLNWQPGGDNSFAGNLNLNYDLNYQKGDWTWDNKILASYGLTNNKQEDASSARKKDLGYRKTDDQLVLNSTLGKKINGFWNASFFMNFNSQFQDGFDYEDDFIDQNQTIGDQWYGYNNEDFPTSGFFKPAYLSFGPGLLWKKNDNLSINFSPLTPKFTFLSGEVFTYNSDTVEYDSSNDVKTYGVDPGESYLFELGLNIRAYYKLDIMKNINIENIFNVFSDYLDKPQNVDINYTMNVVMKINDVFSTNLTFQTIYNDNSYSGFQIREVFGLGVNVKL